jgi:hypothetical protein
MSLSQLVEVKLLHSVIQFHVYFGLSPVSWICAKFMAQTQLLCCGNRFIAVQARVIAPFFLCPVFRILHVKALLFCYRSFCTSSFWLIEFFFSVTQNVTNSMDQSPSRQANIPSASQEIFSFCGTGRYLTLYRTARHLFLSWARWIQSTHFHPIFKIRF